MQETQDDLDRLQQLLDDLRRRRRHLLDVIPPERRLDAASLVARLDGMRLLVLATVTADGRPIAGPVDGIFYRGAFHFGSSPDSFRFRHIRSRPAVSATHLDGEEFSVTVHGNATEIDLKAIPNTPTSGAPCSTSTPRGTAPSGRRSSTPDRSTPGSTPERMFTFLMPEPADRAA